MTDTNKKMDVVLCAVNARYSHSSLAIRCLREGVEKHGHNAILIEASINDRREHVRRRLYECGAQVYCFSTYIWNVNYILELADEIKQLIPDCKIVLGGPEVSYNAEKYIANHDFIDYISIGEGESTLPVLLDKIKASDNSECKAVVSRSWADTNTQTADFENTPLVYRECDITQLENKVVYFESQRGCPFSCTYCLSQNDKCLRYKSIEDTVEQIKFLCEHNVKLIKFVDRTFNSDRSRARILLKKFIQLGYDTQMHFEICAHLLEQEDFEIIKTARKGIFLFEVGIQSTDINVLEKIKRPINVEKTLSNLKRLYQLGNVNVHADLICGLPTETKDGIIKSFNDVCNNCSDLQLGFLKFIHGCEITKNKDVYSYCYSKIPPYEILSSDTLPYKDILELKDVEQALNRFKNTHIFDNCINYVLSYTIPYQFFYSLTQFLKSKNMLNDNVARKTDFFLLYEFLKANGFDRKAQVLLCIDYATANKGEVLLENCAVDKKMRAAFLRNQDMIDKYLQSYLLSSKNIDKFCDIYRFNFVIPKVLLFDRKNAIILDITKDFNNLI